MPANLGARILPLLLLLLCFLTGCAGSPEPPLGSGQRSRYQVGRPSYQVSPYQINGVWYYPKVDYGYDVTGTASWYGPGFDRQPTSNGEIYDMNQLSAAHKTLPLPSIVEVTNLQNGRAVKLRVNDRGPFVGDRLIDLSRRGAQMLGFEGSGTAPVRVRVMREESIQVAQAAMRGEFGPSTSTAFAQAVPAVRTETVAAAPAPRREPPPATRYASAGPASLHAAEVIAGPIPTSESAPVAALPSRPAAPAFVQAPPPQIAAARLPPEPAPPPVAMPEPAPQRTAVASASPRRYWPSLIAQAHAENFRPGVALIAPPPEKPAPMPPAHRGGRIFVQAGAFSVPENAQRVRARIAALGSTEVVPTQVNGTAMYRVRLGPVASEAEAGRLLSKVVDSGYPGARVVAE